MSTKNPKARKKTQNGRIKALSLHVDQLHQQILIK
jgi:hypothetical protein